MSGPTRPPPPITVVDPQRGPAPAEVLVAGPTGARGRRPLPRRLRALAAAVVLVLGAGVAVAAEQRRPVPPPVTVLPAGPAFPGVAAQVALVAEEPLVTRLDLRVVLAGGEAGRGDTGGPAEPTQLRLVDVTARGFAVRLERTPPLVLGAVGRFSSGQEEVVPLSADVVVVDCSVEVGAQRAVRLSLRAGDGPVGSVLAQAGPGVVRALDDLVRRTCRRPRG